eukprot:evm.model.scf_1883.5 EVM.evm.TU.scf_1883.5   scf_1883:21738-26677(+)
MRCTGSVVLSWHDLNPPVLPARSSESRSASPAPQRKEGPAARHPQDSPQERPPSRENERHGAADRNRPQAARRDSGGDAAAAGRIKQAKRGPPSPEPNHGENGERRKLAKETSPPQTTRLYVGKLTRNVMGEHVHEIFSKFGNVKNVVLAIDKAVNLPRGYAHVEFENREAAHKAMDYMDGGQIDGSEICVRLVPVPLRKVPSPVAHPPQSPARRDGATLREHGVGWERGRVREKGKPGDKERGRRSPRRWSPGARRSPFSHRRHSPPPLRQRSPPPRRSPPRYRSPVDSRRYPSPRRRSPPRGYARRIQQSPPRRRRSPSPPRRRPSPSPRFNRAMPPRGRGARGRSPARKNEHSRTAKPVAASSYSSSGSSQSGSGTSSSGGRSSYSSQSDSKSKS